MAWVMACRSCCACRRNIWRGQGMRSLSAARMWVRACAYRRLPPCSSQRSRRGSGLCRGQGHRLRRRPHRALLLGGALPWRLAAVHSLRLWRAQALPSLPIHETRHRQQVERAILLRHRRSRLRHLAVGAIRDRPRRCRHHSPRQFASRQLERRLARRAGSGRARRATGPARWWCSMSAAFEQAERRYKGIDVYAEVAKRFRETHPALAARVGLRSLRQGNKRRRQGG